MRYLDTSVLVAFLIPEAGSGVAEALMTSDGDPLVISTWTEVELVSALGFKLRTRQITEREAHSAIDACTGLVAPCLRRIQVDDADQRKAVVLLDGWALRAGDGLHLAIADAHRATIYTFDQGMANAGATLGIAVRLLEIT